MLEVINIKRILYIHGLGGGANGRVSNILRQELGEEYIIDAPEIPILPEQANEYVKNITFNTEYDLIVASSLGAFYALSAPSHIKKILINPAIYADEYVEKYIGKGIHDFRAHRSNGDTSYTIDDTFIEQLKIIRQTRYIDDEDKIMLRCYVSTEDELLIDNYKACEQFFYDRTIHYINSPHSVDENELKNKIIPDIIADEPVYIPPWVQYGVIDKVIM